MSKLIYFIFKFSSFFSLIIEISSKKIENFMYFVLKFSLYFSVFKFC